MTPIYLLRVAALAGLYFLTGKLGLLLAVPPGYATLIWPASGIAVGFLLAQGWRLWPGVFLGSLLLNAHNAGVFALPDWLGVEALAAACIAAGSTLQALLGRALVARVAGLPLDFRSARQIALALFLAGPVVCVTAASVGVVALFVLGIAARGELLTNWLSWWSGDLLGVLVFMPLVLLAPGNHAQVSWRGRPVGRVPVAAFLLVLLPLLVTFYAWKAITEYDYRRGESKFRALAVESERALQNRLASYGSALIGAAGFFQASDRVSRDEWRTYVRTLDVGENFPGIYGLGWIEAVAPADLPRFLAERRADGSPGFRVHPDGGDRHYVISFIEPEEQNRQALGLNIAFEGERAAAAERARDSGAAAMTGRLVLVQDQQRSPGFLLLHPIYRRGMPVGTPQQRRAALQGWTYAPFIARDFFEGLTHSQAADFRLTVYDGTAESPAALFHSGATAIGPRPAYTVRTTVEVMQRQWTLVWQSAPAFEQAERSANPNYVLVSGLLFTALLALLLVVLSVRRIDHLEQAVGARRFAVPALVFLVLAAGALTLYSKLRDLEAGFVREQMLTEASKIEALLRNHAHERVSSLARIAARWAAANGTPEALWRLDAANHVVQLPGLRALEWIGPDYRVRWVEPLEGNEAAMGIDVRFDAPRAEALRGAADRRGATLTAPIELVQGYTAFIAYLPLTRDGRFDGFIAGVFALDDFFTAAMRTEDSGDFSITLLHAGRTFYNNAAEAAAVAPVDREVRIEDEAWTLRVVATPAFVAAQQSALPSLVLVAGLLVAALAALSARYMLISRLKSAHLAESLALNAGIISNSAHLVIAIDPEYRIVLFNRAAEMALGYAAQEVVGRRAIPIFLDPQELEERARTLSAEIGEAVPVGPRIFTEIPRRVGHETREWTFVRKDGSRFPANVVITPLRDDQGHLTGYLGVIEDIRVRKEVEQLKSEFTAVVSHELRTPLTSIKGSLGLILGAMAGALPSKVKDLLEIAQSNCERLMLLVNDILDIEKFSAGQMRFHPQTLPVADLVSQAAAAVEGYARRFNARLDVAAIDPHCRITVDPDRFVQVMFNLLSNAAKYSPAGGAVSVWAEGRGDRVRVAVRDLGPGIPDEFRERIFEKFSQADASTTRQKGGTGLGLYIARRFVEHMDGRIGYESEVGVGSTFWVEFPIAADTSVPANADPVGV